MLTLLKPYGDPKLEQALVGGLVDVIGLDETDPALRQSELLQKLASADFLMGDVDVAVTDQLLSHAPKLRAVICRSIGVDFVDIQAATQRGILVLNSPLFCVTAVAEYALALMLCLAHRLPEAVSIMDAGDWEARETLRGTELANKTLGLVGCGRIGRELMRMAKGIGMRVLAYDPFVKESDITLVSLQELLSQSDVVSIHSPLTPMTRGLLGAAQLEQMKQGALLINVSRGGIVDEDALRTALQSGRLLGAGLDALSEEPLSANHCLFRTGLSNLVLTPHAAWNTHESHQRNQAAFYRQIADLVQGRLPDEGVLNAQVGLSWMH